MPVFFRELLRDGQLDRAVAAARQAVEKRPDHWMPALFLRLKSGRIWYDTGFGGGHEGDVVGCRNAPFRGPDRVVDDVDTVGDRRVDRTRQVGRIAACARVAGTQPTGFVNGDARFRRNAFDAVDLRTEDRGVGAVSGGRGRRVCAMTVHIARREDLSFVNKSGVLSALRIPARPVYPA